MWETSADGPTVTFGPKFEHELFEPQPDNRPPDNFPGSTHPIVPPTDQVALTRVSCLASHATILVQQLGSFRCSKFDV